MTFAEALETIKGQPISKEVQMIIVALGEIVLAAYPAATPAKDAQPTSLRAHRRLAIGMRSTNSGERLVRCREPPRPCAA